MKFITKIFLAIVTFSIFIGVFVFNANAASVSYYQTVKSSVPIWSNASSNSTKVKTVSSTGTVLKVVGSTRNSAGNLWFKLQDGRWVFSGNVKKHSHSYSGGKCTGKSCGYEWPYTVHSTSGEYVVTASSGAKTWSRPYSSNSTHISTYVKGSIVNIVASTKNQHGNTWYRLSDGRWIYSGDLTRRYTVSYSANGGKGAPTKQSFLSGNNTTISSTKPTRVGYLFNGWATSSSASKPKYYSGSKYKFTSNVALYAVWVPCKHSYSGGICTQCKYTYPHKETTLKGTFVVTGSSCPVYNRPYSTNSKKVTTYSKGKVVAIVAQTKNQPGNLWYKLSDGNWVYSGNVTQRYTVSYNANGGKSAPTAQNVMKGSKLKLSSQKPTRVGYIFKGWSTSASSKVVKYKPGDTISNNSNISLYAVWSSCIHSYNGGICNKCNYTYPNKVSTYNGTFVVTISSSPIYNRPYSTNSKKVATYKKNKVLTVVAQTKNQAGNLWYKLSDGNWVFSGNVTQRYTISYNAMGGKNAPASQNFYKGKFVRFSSKKPTKVGYIFKGWSTSSSASKVNYNTGAYYLKNSNVTLYAVWSPCKHEKYQGGICTACKYEYKYEVTKLSGSYMVVTNNSPVWTIPYSSGSSKVVVKQAKNSVVYVSGKTTNVHGSVWYKLTNGNWIYSGNVKRCYSISYDANGGKTAPNKTYFLPGTTVTVSKNGPTVNGYIFVGWSTKKNSGVVDYKPGAKTSRNNDLKLYAVWSRNGVNPVKEVVPVNALSLSTIKTMYNNKQKINATDSSKYPAHIKYYNNAGKNIGYYISSNGCTWYAIARYNYVNGPGRYLKFQSRGGNADNWAYSIDKNCFYANSTTNHSVIVSNSIGVSTKVSAAYDSGVHVVYIEAVDNGYVYYTQGSYGYAVSTYGKMCRKTVAEFAKEYEYVLTAK